MKTEQIQRTRGTFYIVKVKNDFKQKSKSILAGEVEITRLNYRLKFFSKDDRRKRKNIPRTLSAAHIFD